MIIEKKSNIVDPKKVVIPENWVLIKADPNYTTYQNKGKDIGIATTDFAYDGKGGKVSIKERNFSVTGTVYAVPNRLYFAGRKVYEAQKLGGSAPEGMFRRSVQFDTDVEVKVGDRVRFSYTSHTEAVNAGMSFETTEGEMFFMKYDKLFMTVDKDGNPEKVLNGYILAEADKIETKNEGGAEVRETNSGIVIATLGKKDNRKRKIATGKCILCGSPIRGNLNFLGENEPIHEIENGAKILFDPRGSKRLEPLNHQHHKEDLLLLHPRTLIFVSDNSTNFVDKLESIQI